MTHKEIRNLKDLSQQQVHQGDILIKYLAECYSTVQHCTYCNVQSLSQLHMTHMTQSFICYFP